MIDYATSEQDCRRVTIGSHFGDHVSDCLSRDIVACDLCNGEPVPWSSLPDHLVADPELLVNAELTVLQAVAWASMYREGRYGEASLKAAVLGNESLGEGRPLGQGVLSCPQFGALRHVRNGAKRWDDALAKLIGSGHIARTTVEREKTLTVYQSLALTAVGAQSLGIPLGHND